MCDEPAMVLRVVPGRLTAEEAMAHLLFEKRCEHCNTRLDIWGRFPKDYHAPYCRYFMVAPEWPQIVSNDGR